MPDTLDEDPIGAVSHARGAYLRALGADPNDASGKVARAREIYRIIASEAEHRAGITNVDAVHRSQKRKARQGAAWDFLRTLWAGIPGTARKEEEYLELREEEALVRGEWIDWVRTHRSAAHNATIDHLASVIPSQPGESWGTYRDRLERLRLSWQEGAAERVVNFGTPFVPPGSALLRSRSTGRTPAAPRGRTRGSLSSASARAGGGSRRSRAAAGGRRTAR